jgi:hypothetical protein
MHEDNFYIWINKNIKTQIIIWKIIKWLIFNQDYFNEININEISKDYKICKKTLKKYLKNYFIKIQWKNEKRLKIKDNIEIQFFRDLEKIVSKYYWYVDNSTIKKWQYYINNLRQ